MQPTNPTPYYRLYPEQTPPRPVSPLPLTPPPAGVGMPVSTPPDKDTPLLRLFGSGMTLAQFQRCTKQSASRWLMASLVTLLAILSIASVGLATMYVGAMEGSFLGAMQMVALVLAVLAARRNDDHARRELARRWKLHAAATEGGLTTTWYVDRVVQASTRWCEVVRFSDRTRYVEHEELLVLEDDAHRVVLRAEDLTPEQAQAVYERICAVVPPARQYAAGRFFATRTQPLPPPFPTAEPARYERFSAAFVSEKSRFLKAGGLWLWIVAMSMALAGQLTAMFAVTPYFLLDYVLFAAGLLAAAAGVSAFWLWRDSVAAEKARRRQEPMVTLTFTGEGLHIAHSETEQFVVAADVYARRTENGARLYTPAGHFVFPWNAAQNRQQLEWMLFGQRY